MIDQQGEARIEEIKENEFADRGIRLCIKREDRLHEHISGNKWRKLKYNLSEARERGFTTILTFGGAFSNHIAATAAAGMQAGFNTIGVIRGEEPKAPNPTLSYARKCGMQLHFISRTDYRQKHTEDYIGSLKTSFGPFYLLPEGGSNSLAVKGCSEILDDTDRNYDYICVPVGTGGTLAGLIAGAKKESIIGFSALKGAGFLEKPVNALLADFGSIGTKWQIDYNHYYGGYARYSKEVVDFISDFRQKHHIRLDPIYTSKMMMGIYDWARQGKFAEGASVLAIHTGGLQGIQGFNERYGTKL